MDDVTRCKIEPAGTSKTHETECDSPDTGSEAQNSPNTRRGEHNEEKEFHKSNPDTTTITMM